MITTALVYFSVALIIVFLGALSLIPGDSGFPAEVDTYMGYVATYIGKADVFIPLDTLFFCISFIVTFEVAIVSFKIIKWLFSYVPFVGK